MANNFYKKISKLLFFTVWQCAIQYNFYRKKKKKRSFQKEKTTTTYYSIKSSKLFILRLNITNDVKNK